MSLTAPANIADAVNQLPALATGLNPRTGNVNTGLGVAGLNLLNLRNLGSTRTPVLVNSRRAAPSKSSGLVDVSTIPQQLVRRVQVVTGGASAAYGSDAVTEVVNFIHTSMQRWKLQGQSAPRSRPMDLSAESEESVKLAVILLTLYSFQVHILN